MTGSKLSILNPEGNPSGILLSSTLLESHSCDWLVPLFHGILLEPQTKAIMGAKSLHFLCFFFSFLMHSRAFTPQDNHLVNCGSKFPTVAVGNRLFVGDSSDGGSSYISLGEGGFALENPNPSSSSSSIYGTARVFTSAAKYSFEIKDLGTHLVRLHFSPFASGTYDLKNGNFGVLANGASILRGYSANSTVIKEFFLMVDRDKLEILFTPVDHSSFAYVNAIEVFSAPKGFFVDAGEIALLNPDGPQRFTQNLSTQVLETLHRINVGGPVVTPFNDTLWRTWIPDEDFLFLKSAAKVARTTHPPNYQSGGATRENAPDAVYMTAQQMNIVNHSSSFLFNITWEFPVSSEDSVYLVRLHFCDIVSIALHTLYFDVYINEVTAYKDLDLSVLTFHQLASPYYIDFAVSNPKDYGAVRVSIGPADLSTTSRKNAILNGLEIMRMVNFNLAPAPAPVVSGRRSIWIYAGPVLAGFILVTLAILATYFAMIFKFRRRLSESSCFTSVRKTEGSSHATLSEATVLASLGPYGHYGLKIPFVDIQLATNNFDSSLIIGSGGFGTVYRGTLKDTIKVAVKRGVPGSRQGLPEFHTEVMVLSKIRHRHLVSLVGYCEEQSEMILVYEYMEKGPLRNHLYGSDLPSLSWKQRLEICIGAARGLHYLHTGSAQGIIHRDIKSTNILLDEDYVAKVADFGLSRSGPCVDESHVSTGVKGSFGYLDPEYFRLQQLTDKSDIYSFGVVLFEVLCARPAVNPSLVGERANLAECAAQWHKKGLIEQMMDPHLAGQIEPASLKKFSDTAIKCLANYSEDRPTMGEVLWNLEHAYQLQIQGIRRDARDGEDDSMAPAPAILPASDEVGEDAISDISRSAVFSQLLSRKGR